MSEPEIETVRRVAELARLAIGDEEARELAGQFARTLEHFRVLSEADVSTVEGASGGALGPGRLRRDEPRAGFSAEEALRGAPARVDDFYRVPKTVGGEG